jgi:hypothetical protein
MCDDDLDDRMMRMSAFAAPELQGPGYAQLKLHDVEVLLVDAIEQWMQVSVLATVSQLGYAHGNAQGIARALAVLRGTTFTEEWSAGLDRYQNRVATGQDTL